MRVVVIGSAGQLGADLMRALAAAGASAVGFDFPDFDVTSAQVVETRLRELSPTHVINCAAWTNVEDAEDRVRDVLAVNAEGALNVARTCAGLDARLIFISTDYVFGGDAQRLIPYAEYDRPAPLNVYGWSKLAGEHATLSSCPGSLVVRSASLYGHAGARGKGGNFVETMLRLGRERDEVRVVRDQWMSPTSTLALARALVELLSADVAGILHVAAPDHCSWSDFAAGIFRVAGLSARVTPIPADEYPTRARRPRFAALAGERLASLGLALLPWREMLVEYLERRGEFRDSFTAARAAS